MSSGDSAAKARPKGLCLCYHALSETWDATLSVKPEAFRRQIAFLLDRGYQPCTFTDFAMGRGGSKPLAITFDDAFQSVAEFALPILRELGAVATVFVPTAYVAGEKPLAWPGTAQWLETEHALELEPMTWQTLAGLHEDGWEIGSHTHTHPDLCRIDAATLERELSESLRIISEHIGSEEVSLAYPYGSTSPQVQEAARRAGYACAASLPKGNEGSTLYDVPRVGVYHADGDLAFRAKVSPVINTLRRTPAWKYLGRGLRTGRRIIHQASARRSGEEVGYAISLPLQGHLLDLQQSGFQQLLAGGLILG